jgi:acetyl-CoA acetyltransferase
LGRHLGDRGERAFASVVLHSRTTGLEDRFADVANGGGILGHPLGATGARVARRSYRRARAPRVRYGIACMHRLRQAIAAVVERV